MITQWEMKNAVRHVKLARYLIAQADSKQLTHGEKHYLHEVALRELVLALKDMNKGSDITTIHQDDTSLELSDIPF